MLDDPMKRQIGITLLIILGAFGTVLIEHISQLGWSLMWVWFIGITWYASETLGAYIIWHFFRVTKADIPGSKVVLTKVESIPEAIVGSISEVNEIKPEDFTEVSSKP